MKILSEKFGKVDQFFIWGRSMGAATALMLAEERKVYNFEKLINRTSSSLSLIARLPGSATSLKKSERSSFLACRF
jgi:hypothetical protein